MYKIYELIFIHEFSSMSMNLEVIHKQRSTATEPSKDIPLIPEEFHECNFANTSQNESDTKSTGSIPK